MNVVHVGSMSDQKVKNQRSRTTLFFEKLISIYGFKIKTIYKSFLINKNVQF